MIWCWPECLPSNGGKFGINYKMKIHWEINTKQWEGEPAKETGIPQFPSKTKAFGKSGCYESQRDKNKLKRIWQLIQNCAELSDTSIWQSLGQLENLVMTLWRGTGRAFFFFTTQSYGYRIRLSVSFDCAACVTGYWLPRKQLAARRHESKKIQTGIFPSKLNNSCNNPMGTLWSLP